jgi:vacuolar-type H+-ATPase subunit D/Vma8
MQTEIPEELKEAHAEARRAEFECSRLREALAAAQERRQTLKTKADELWDQFFFQTRRQIEEVTDTTGRELAAPAEEGR